MTGDIDIHRSQFFQGMAIDPGIHRLSLSYDIPGFSDGNP